jgi:hypothetical protein
LRVDPEQTFKGVGQVGQDPKQARRKNLELGARSNMLLLCGSNMQILH